MTKRAVKHEPQMLKALRLIRGAFAQLGAEKVEAAVVTSAALDCNLRYIVAAHGRNHAQEVCRLCSRHIEEGLFDPELPPEIGRGAN